MTARPTRWIVSAILLFLVAGAALAITVPLVLGTAPASSAQVGVLYSSALTASGGTPPYSYSIVANPNLLPPGLILNAGTGVIFGHAYDRGDLQLPGPGDGLLGV